ncbi:MAG: hypothetical protein JSS43_26130 [Proteobacteria bacterium]|nr:hypothetical protein [Pseudomonadota bacterium]
MTTKVDGGVSGAHPGLIPTPVLVPPTGTKVPPSGVLDNAPVPDVPPGTAPAPDLLTSDMPVLSAPGPRGGTEGALTLNALKPGVAFRLTELFSALLEAGQESKQVARIDREVRLNKVEADAKKAADDARAGAWMAFTATAVTSLAQVVGGAMNASSTLKAQTKFDQAYKGVLEKTPDAHQAAVEAGRVAFQTASALPGFRATLVSEGGKIGGAIPQVIAQHFEAQKSEDQAEAAREQAKADEEGDLKHEMAQLIATVLQNFSQIQQTEASMDNAVAQRMNMA